MSGCSAGARHASDRICVTAVSKSLPGRMLFGAPPSGALICALLSRSQAGGPTGLGIFAWTNSTVDQPGGTFSGTKFRSQVSTGPTCPHVHGPNVLAVALTPNVSLTWIGPE